MAYRQTEEENKTGLSGGQAGAGKTDKLQIHDLCVDFATQHGTVHAVKGVTLTAVKGRITALVGESGSGKSVTSLAVMDLLARNGRIASGRILYGGRDLLTLPERERRKLNGTVFSMIFSSLLCYCFVTCIRYHMNITKATHTALFFILGSSPLPAPS